MKYTIEVDIDLPREKVVALFDNTENLYKWQKGLVSFKHLSGEPGKVGAKSEMTFDMGNRKMVLTETITYRNLPEEFHGTYDANGVHNIQKNYFEIVDPNTTKWRSESIFKFKGIQALIFPFMKGMFKKQSRTYLENFKKFAETGESVN